MITIVVGFTLKCVCINLSTLARVRESRLVELSVVTNQQADISLQTVPDILLLEQLLDL